MKKPAFMEEMASIFFNECSFSRNTSYISCNNYNYNNKFYLQNHNKQD